MWCKDDFLWSKHSCYSNYRSGLLPETAAFIIMPQGVDFFVSVLSDCRYMSCIICWCRLFVDPALDSLLHLHERSKWTAADGAQGNPLKGTHRRKYISAVQSLLQSNANSSDLCMLANSSVHILRLWVSAWQLHRRLCIGWSFEGNQLWHICFCCTQLAAAQCNLRMM